MDNFTFDPTSQDIFPEESLSIDESSLRPGNARQANSEDILPVNFKSDTLLEIAKYGGYSTYNSQSNTDPYVRQALKNFSRDRYDAIYGYTRKPEGTMGMYKSLAKFGNDVNSFHALNHKQRKSMVRAIQKAKKAFKLPWKREPLDWHDVGQFLRRDTAAGVTFMGSKKGDVMEEIYHEARWLGHRMKQDGRGRFNPTQMRFPPCLAGQRGGMSEVEAPKTRLVWVYPAEMLVIEGFYAPLMYRDYMKDPLSPMLPRPSR
jgi:hypothetical protein